MSEQPKRLMDEQEAAWRDLVSRTRKEIASPMRYHGPECIYCRDDHTIVAVADELDALRADLAAARTTQVTAEVGRDESRRDRAIQFAMREAGAQRNRLLDEKLSAELAKVRRLREALEYADTALTEIEAMASKSRLGEHVGAREYQAEAMGGLRYVRAALSATPVPAEPDLRETVERLTGERDEAREDYQAATQRVGVCVSQLVDLRAQVRRLRSSVKGLVDAMHRYSMDVDEEPPYEHCQMMKRARAALSATPVPAEPDLRATVRLLREALNLAEVNIRNWSVSGFPTVEQMSAVDWLLQVLRDTLLAARLSDDLVDVGQALQGDEGTVVLSAAPVPAEPDLRESVRRLREALESVTYRWNQNRAWPTCVSCNQPKGEPHLPSCGIDQALQAAEPGGKGE